MFPKSQYFQGNFPKKRICLHHTMGYSAQSSIDWFIDDPAIVGTQYIIDRDGKTYELWQDNGYAYQFGLVGVPRRIEFEQTTIGIELANLGPLTKLQNGSFADQYGKPYKGEVHEAKYRGFQYWEKYSEQQYAALRTLINSLAKKHNIIINPTKNIEYDLNVFDKYTLITHTNVRRDKTDLSPAFDWSKII